MCLRFLYLVAGASWATSWNHPMASRGKHLQIGQLPGSSNKVSLGIYLGLESLFMCSESLETDLLFVWNSLKVTGTVGIVLSLHLVVWVLCEELGNRTYYC
jgi:hypothetical protein